MTSRKGRAVAGILLASTLLLTPLAVRGDGRGAIPRFAVEIDSGAVFVREAGFGSGLKFNGGVFFRTGHRMGVGLSLERFAVPVESGTAGLLSAGRMTMTTLLVNEQLYLLTKGRLLPYALMGIGFTLLGYSPDSWPADVPRRVFVDRMALQIGAGLDVRISPKLAVCLKARYNLVKTWMENEGRTYPIRDVDPLAQNMLYLYGLGLALGIKIGF
jgi:opacity protein-like surface antigen